MPKTPEESHNDQPEIPETQPETPAEETGKVEAVPESPAAAATQSQVGEKPSLERRPEPSDMMSGFRHAVEKIKLRENAAYDGGNPKTPDEIRQELIKRGVVSEGQEGNEKEALMLGRKSSLRRQVEKIKNILATTTTTVSKFQMERFLPLAEEVVRHDHMHPGFLTEAEKQELYDLPRLIREHNERLKGVPVVEETGGEFEKTDTGGKRRRRKEPKDSFEKERQKAEEVRLRDAKRMTRDLPEQPEERKADEEELVELPKPPVKKQPMKREREAAPRVAPKPPEKPEAKSAESARQESTKLKQQWLDLLRTIHNVYQKDELIPENDKQRFAELGRQLIEFQSQHPDLQIISGRQADMVNDYSAAIDAHNRNVEEQQKQKQVEPKSKPAKRGAFEESYKGELKALGRLKDRQGLRPRGIPTPETVQPGIVNRPVPQETPVEPTAQAVPEAAEEPRAGNPQEALAVPEKRATPAPPPGEIFGRKEIKQLRQSAKEWEEKRSQAGFSDETERSEPEETRPETGKEIFTGDLEFTKEIAQNNLPKFKLWLMQEETYDLSDSEIKEYLGERFHALISGDMDKYLELLAAGRGDERDEELYTEILENNLPYLKTWLINELKDMAVSEDELKKLLGPAYEDLGFDKVQAPAAAKAEKAPETEKSAETGVVLSTEEVKQLVLDELASVAKEKGVTIRNAQLIGEGDRLQLEVDFSSYAGKGKIRSGVLTRGGQLVFENPVLDAANPLIHWRVGDIEERLSQASGRINDFVEAKYGRKVKSFEVKEGQLVINFVS